MKITAAMTIITPELATQIGDLMKCSQYGVIDESRSMQQGQITNETMSALEYALRKAGESEYKREEIKLLKIARLLLEGHRYFFSIDFDDEYDFLEFKESERKVIAIAKSEIKRVGVCE